MIKSLVATIQEPVDTLLRITSLLRRKSFEIRDVEMKFLEKERAKIFISIDEETGCGVRQAMMYLSKMEDVSEIIEL